MSDKQIVIICPYFGKLPDYYRYTMQSMANNDFIDWVIITDLRDYTSEYENVFIKHWDFEAIRERIKNTIGTEIRSFYKLCDYKPAYADIFKEYVEGYTFWGYSDLDIIFGDLKQCFSNKNLLDYDKIIELGHLSIYRNISDISITYRDLDLYGISYKKVLNSDSIYVYDESYDNNHISINELLELKGYKVLRRIEGCLDIASKYRNLYPAHEKNALCSYLIYDNNKLFICDRNNIRKEELIYAHFQKRSFQNVLNDDFSNFVITPKKMGNLSKINDQEYFSTFRDLKVIWYIKLRIDRWKKNKKAEW